MANLTQLKLNSFSVVKGDDYEPANPGAVAVLFKSSEKEKQQMSKTTQAAEPKTSLAGFIQKAVDAFQKGKVVASYESHSTGTETYDDGKPEGADEVADGPTFIVVTDAVAKAAATPANDAIPGVSEVAKTIAAEVAKGMEPVSNAVTGLAARIEKLEKQPTGSRAIAKGIGGGSGATVTDNGEGRFPEFSKFLADSAGLSPGQKISKATITSATFGSYGLGFEESGNFIDYIVDQSILLKSIRTIKMKNARMPIDKLGLGGKVLVKGTAGVDPGDTVTMNNSQVMLTAQEIIAIVSIGDDTLEDNIEGDAFVQHLLGMVSRSAANEMEQAAMLGDTSVADAGILDRWDGFYKLAKANGAHVIEGMADTDRFWPGVNGKKMTTLLKAIPSKYRIDPKLLRAIQNPDIYLDYLDMLTNTGSVPGTAAITGMMDVPLRSVPNLQMPMLSETLGFSYNSTAYTDGTFVMVTNPLNLILGIHREIKIEPYRVPRARKTDWIISMRGDVKIENADAIGIYDHAKVH